MWVIHGHGVQRNNSIYKYVQELYFSRMSISLICVLLNQQNTTNSCDMYITSLYKIEENYIFPVSCVIYMFSA